MTNTKFRKRALLSSVAMLLVALVALGSATFAWFTSSTSATASGLSIATSKSSELLVAKKDFRFSESVVYDDEAPLYVPATSKDGTTWYTSTAAAKTEFTSNGTYNSPDSLGNVVYDEMLNIKNNGQKEATTVTITVAGTFASDFGRIAVVPCTTAQSQAADATHPVPSITEDQFKANIYSNGNETWTPYGASAAYTSTAFSSISISAGPIAAGAVKSYRILVWFEGEDSDCYDLTSANLTLGTTALSFTVSGG